MRTAKYHDYTLLRILLFIILVILGVFAYKHFVKAPCEHTAPGKAWTTVEATCTDDGYRYKTCTECGEQFDNQVLPATGHKADDTVVEIEAATCTKAGTGYKACLVCGEHLETVVIPTVEHIAGETVVENEKEHTATQGASYENVVYCTECKGEISRKKVEVEHNVTVTTTTISLPTCTDNGEKKTVTYCNDCEKQLSVDVEYPAALGHKFDFEVTYDYNENGEIEFTLSGKCTASECDHVYDPAEDEGYTLSIEHNHGASDPACVAPTCVNGYCAYVATVKYNGQKVDEIIVKETIKYVDNHTILNAEGQLVNIFESDYAIKDPETGRVYFNFSDVCIYLAYDKSEGQTITEAMSSEWDENGFASGVIKCAACDNWILIIVYNDLA